LKVLNALFLSFVNPLLFRYKHNNQNKADSAVNKNRDLLNLLVQSRIYQKRTLHVTTTYVVEPGGTHGPRPLTFFSGGPGPPLLNRILSK